MKIISDHNKCEPYEKLPTGGYQWWYFDGQDAKTGYRFVIIFYAANPFSIRYIKQAGGAEQEDSPLNYPAVSIAIYRQSKVIYYSFREFDRKDLKFETHPFKLTIGTHSLIKTVEKNHVVFCLNLSDNLPGGDSLKADLTFKRAGGQQIFNNAKNLINQLQRAKHVWNLVMPVGGVQGKIDIKAAVDENHNILFNGTGYHDHNVGLEAMKDSFFDWYWGRFHFENYTLIYYAMNHNGKEGQDEAAGENFYAWLFDLKSGNKVLKTEDVKLYRRRLNVFGLVSCRALEITGSEGWKTTIYQPKVIDNGPFYQRFLSNAVLHLESKNTIEAALGITEYIRPGRIYTRLFWPLVKMRMNYINEKPHWVQLHPGLYRRTW